MKYTLICLGLLISAYSQAQSYCCQPQDVRVRSHEGYTTNGSINEAQFTITPRGIYFEIGMYLTLSAKDANYINWQNEFIDLEKREFDLNSRVRFKLPKESMVTDAWLWINEAIIQADFEERWRPNRLTSELSGFEYPLFLAKDTWSPDDENSYSLMIYPMQGDSTRRVKITYLTPGLWSQGQVSVNLPTDFLATSKVPVENVSVQCFLEERFFNPSALQFPNRDFSFDSHATLGEFSQMLFTGVDIKNGLDISFDVNMQNGIFLSNYYNGMEAFYQMAILPSKILWEDELAPKKVAFLIDYDTANTTISKAVLLENLKIQMKNNLKTGDLFNLIFIGQNGLELITPNWINASNDLIDNIFTLLEEAYTLSDESHLTQLLDAGLTFVEEQASGDYLFLLSCSDDLYNVDEADAYLNTLIPAPQAAATSIIIADYQDKNQSRNSFETLYTDEAGHTIPFESFLYGNEYFYLELNELFLGSMQVIREQKNLINLLKSSFDAVNPIQTIETIKVKKGEVACFGEHVLEVGLFDNPNAPILQIGKCDSNFPFSIEIEGKVNNQTVRKTITLDDATIYEGNQSHEVAWAGNYIQTIADKIFFYYTQCDAEEMIKWSFNYRILSVLTALLALEPERGGYLCEECVDETLLSQMVSDLSSGIMFIDDNEIELPTNAFSVVRENPWTIPLEGCIRTSIPDFNTLIFNEISASPNPFQQGVIIKIDLKEVQAIEEINCTIFDLSGKEVKQLIPQQIGNNTEFQTYWDGTDDQNQRLPTGIYIMAIRTPKGVGSLKLALMK